MIDKIAVPIPHSYWVEPQRLLAGEHPGSINQQYARETLRALLDAGIATFIDLSEQHEWPDYAQILHEERAHARATPRYHRIAFPDQQIASIDLMAGILNLIDRSLADGRPAYVHCLAGIGRTGTVVGCYLVRHGMSGGAALRKLTWLRRHSPDSDLPSPESHVQRQFVLGWRSGA